MTNLQLLMKRLVVRYLVAPVCMQMCLGKILTLSSSLIHLLECVRSKEKPQKTPQKSADMNGCE